MHKPGDWPAFSLPLRRPAPGGERVSKHRAEWCTRCEDWKVIDILPGHPATNGQGGVSYGPIPSFAFCVFCGFQVDVDLEESA